MSRTLVLRSAAAVAGSLALTMSLTACGGSSAGSADSGGAEKVVTVYSADGLKSEKGDGWYDRVFADFTKKTGIEVKYVEGGSGEMVQRAVREKTNTQADVLITLPPFIQQADGKGLLQSYVPRGADKVNGADKSTDGKWTSVVNNYFGFVHNKKELPEAPRTWEELLDARYKGKLQYSTPGVAGDGTAVLIKAMHDFGGKEPAMEYLKKLQANNVGPSSSTSKLAPKTDKGELLVANGDVQMNFAQSKSMPNLGIWFPAKDGGRPTTFALPYAAGLVAKAPHSENGKKLLDHLLGEEAQKLVSEVGGGFPARTDVKPTDANAVELTKLMTGVEIFEPDWADIDKNLTAYVDAWKSATGS
ncbi:2-aminoethylphosphonate ABC transporter substrate-binding protein [Streptomyces virginiae]|uniref:2-aminoethylphosphonate ABC transporter substrate-binding protein n=1 Tax=Streptomyces virginiae TaxID=1961 RepID=A0ABQ3NX55_STRVG|nr:MULTISPECIES: 2-aminoethylphosphonate ABC transporter substrate-binding protein [Streptomyces]KOU12152.1 2-aminoethylphosphonate ABC transporter substrate-binding protein [Streptomyces sp. WM6349]KOU78529.1 2-aminoethylphosphonate ABC transporter substrate-binding protein [Streptomyces sp. XY593]KOV43866.1 2-aminoethylphosphonate ABC transporter substrate-binding protein [Streptomyces sp. H036]MBP2344302.1 2-aminoethylphosphonate transport system substrate-binding protein [Streptomyces virgi